MKVTTALVNQVLTGVLLSKEEVIKEFHKVAEINNIPLDWVLDNYNKFIGQIHKSICDIIDEMPKRAKQIMKHN